MANVTIRYYEIDRHGKGRWRPKGSARRLGFRDVACGPDGPVAWAIADDWNRRLDDVRSGRAVSPVASESMNETEREEATLYPPGSVGEAFRRYRKTDIWARKAARTREDWFRGWKRIKPIFGDVDPRTVTLEDLSEWRATLQTVVGVREAHRAVKIWRALWVAMHGLKYCGKDDPSLAFANESAGGRTEVWSEREVRLLVKRAWLTDRKGLACVIAVVWDAMLSPVDGRCLTAPQIKPDASTGGRTGYVSISRRKTGAAATAQLRPIVMRMITAYQAGFGAEVIGPLFRTSRDRVPFTKNSLAEEFRDLRKEVFGPGEKRMLLDMRRSAAQEAFTGGATAANVSRVMGNTLSASNSLFETYVPASNASANNVAEARKRGRQERKVIQIPNRRSGAFPTKGGA